MAIISSNECASEAHGETVSLGGLDLPHVLLTCTASNSSVSRLMIEGLILKSFNVADVNILTSALLHWFFELGQLPNYVSLFASINNHFVLYSKTVFNLGVVFCCTANF